MATISARNSTFPESWGYPAGTQYSEERKRGILERIGEDRAYKRVRDRAAAEAIKVEIFERQRYLLLTRER